MNRLGLRPLALVLAAVWLAACGSAATLFDDIDQLVFPRPGSGDLDLSFGGGDGMVTTDLSSQDEAYAVGVQSDGKIVVAAYYAPGNIAVLRYTTSGVLDLTFVGGDGFVTTDLGGNDIPYALAIQGDKIVVVGSNNRTNPPSDIAVLRYTNSGEPDLSFDDDGIAIADTGSSEQGRAVAIQSDGMIVVAGYSDGDFVVLRYDDDGSLDPTFGTSGVARTNIGSSDAAKALAIQPLDQKIIVVGEYWNGSENVLAAVRYNSDGTLDTTFDTDGIATANIVGVSDESANSVAIQTDGKIVLGGHSHTATRFALVRLNANGSVDTSFGENGFAITAYQNSSIGEAVAIQSGGRIVLGGTTYDGMDNKAAVVRYMPDGSLDSAFGICAFGGPTADAFGKALKIQDDGRLLVAGYAYSGGDYDIMLLRVLP
jgi:uncharacterized delta-60 repeat protein